MISNMEVNVKEFRETEKGEKEKYNHSKVSSSVVRVSLKLGSVHGNAGMLSR